MRHAYQHFEHERARRSSRGSVYSLNGRWPLIATSATRLHAEGHLAAVWGRLDERTAPQMALTDLPVRDDMKPVDVSRTLGRRWNKDDPGFWRRLSPLGTGGYSTSEPEVHSKAQPSEPESDAFATRLRHWREAHLEEARRDAAALNAGARETDLRLPEINGSMDERDDDVEEGSWK